MEEMIDVLDEETGTLTGEVISKTEAHNKGIWHGSIHVLIINNEKNKTLLQKRCELKKLYPNMWDIAVGGHITASEDDVTSAKRELEEELGINTSNIRLERVDRIKEMLVNNGVISNEFVSIFVLYTDISIENIKLQKEEVSEAKWCTKSELNELIKANSMIPHVREYELLNNILTD